MNECTEYTLTMDERTGNVFIEAEDGTRYGPYLTRCEAELEAQWIYCQ